MEEHGDGIPLSEPVNSGFHALKFLLIFANTTKVILEGGFQGLEKNTVGIARGSLDSRKSSRDFIFFGKIFSKTSLFQVFAAHSKVEMASVRGRKGIKESLTRS